MSKYRNYPPKEKGFSHILVLVAVTLVAGLLVSSKVQTTKEFPANTSQNILGENEDKSAEQVKEATQKTAEQQKESSTSKTQTSPAGFIMNTQSEGRKQETEIETANGQKIKTKVEDNGTTKVELEHGKLKIKYSVENGRVKLETENEASEGAKLSEKETKDVEDEVENELEKEGVKISTTSGHLAIAKNKFAATSNFPLSINVGTRQLVVTTPAGQKIVTILPDQAVQNLLSTGVINKIASQSATPDLTKDLGDLAGVVKLETRNNEVVYRVAGEKDHKLFGFIPVSTTLTAFVSAEKGNLVAEDQSLLSDLIKLLSPQ